jgi:hypothetical protein
VIDPFAGSQLTLAVLFFHVLLSPSGSDRIFNLFELFDFIPDGRHGIFLQAGEGRFSSKS